MNKYSNFGTTGLKSKTIALTLGFLTIAQIGAGALERSSNPNETVNHSKPGVVSKVSNNHQQPSRIRKWVRENKSGIVGSTMLTAAVAIIVAVRFGPKNLEKQAEDFESMKTLNDIHDKHKADYLPVAWFNFWSIKSSLINFFTFYQGNSTLKDKVNLAIRTADDAIDTAANSVAGDNGKTAIKTAYEAATEKFGIDKEKFAKSWERGGKAYNNFFAGATDKAKRAATLLEALKKATENLKDAKKDAKKAALSTATTPNATPAPQQQVTISPVASPTATGGNTVSTSAEPVKDEKK